MLNEDRVMAVLRDAKRLALEYRQLTGKPLGVTGEIAEFEAARILSLQLSVARQAGYDAVENANSVTGDTKSDALPAPSGRVQGHF